MQRKPAKLVSVAVQSDLATIAGKYRVKCRWLQGPVVPCAPTYSRAYFCFYSRPFIIFIWPAAAYFCVHMHFPWCVDIQHPFPHSVAALLYFYVIREKVSGERYREFYANSTSLSHLRPLSRLWETVLWSFIKLYFPSLMISLQFYCHSHWR